MLKFLIVVSNSSLYVFYVATGEPYVHEFKEFPGVTIIFRTAANPKAFEKLESHGKVGMQSSRRKPEFEHGDKTDHTGNLLYSKKHGFSMSLSHYHSKLDILPNFLRSEQSFSEPTMIFNIYVTGEIKIQENLKFFYRKN
jgi:hypothetical protein